MKVLIVAKTRRGAGACVGGITEQGQSVRLIASDADANARAGMEYDVGDVWEIEFAPDQQLVPPHVENIIVISARKMKASNRIEEAIHRFMPPFMGGPEQLFDGFLQAAPSGVLYIAQRTGVPRRSTTFWVPDEPLELDCRGKRLHYRYRTNEGWRMLTFVGFQEPVQTIPAGTLLRVSLAHWWRPSDGREEERRCYLQLSGWFLKEDTRTNCPRSDDEKEDLRIDCSPSDACCALKQTFGYAEFLPLQENIITWVLDRNDALVVMPTGGGKSLCYQLPGVMFDGLTVVVSPLIALMEDQVRQLLALNIPAAFLNSTVAHKDYVAIKGLVRKGDVKILYVAPETLLRPETLMLLEQSRLRCLAVDEAHCISEWGHDFRPDYRQLPKVRRRFPHAVCIALTATATARVRADVRQLLGIAREGEFVASFNRPNLFLRVEPRARDGLAQTLAFLANHRGECGIIYCATRKRVDELSAALNASGWPALPYHAGMSDEARRDNQARFTNGEVPLIVATIAFGMGINKANVRFVLHVNLPKDLESYYQEIGRAGRDGLPSECLLLYSRADAMTIKHFINGGATAQRAGRKERLNAMMRFSETLDCRRVPLLAYFGESASQSCETCDNCRPCASLIHTKHMIVPAGVMLDRRRFQKIGEL